MASCCAGGLYADIGPPGGRPPGGRACLISRRWPAATSALVERSIGIDHFDIGADRLEVVEELGRVADDQIVAFSEPT